MVHISSGISALVAAIVLGKRRGFPDAPMPPHDLPFTLLGAGILWFGFFGFSAVSLRGRTGIDDSLDVFGVHGIGGTLGALLTGVFASTAINPAGADGLLHGNPRQLGVQGLTVLVTWVYSAVVTLVLLKVLDAVMGLRVTSDGEEAGLDVDQHRESAYSI